MNRPNPLKVDPTRTSTQRRAFEKEINKRLNRLKRKIVDLIDREDAFGLRQGLPAFNVFCPTGLGGGIDPTCSPSKGGAGSSDVKTLDSFNEVLPLNKYGSREGVRDVGAVTVKVYRVGDVSAGNRGGVFFAGSAGDVESYKSLHEGKTVEAYNVSLKKVVVAGHQNDLTKAWFRKGYGEMMDSYARRYGAQGAHVASSAFDKKILGEAKKRGYDGLILLSPAPPAKTELAVIGSSKIVESKIKMTANVLVHNEHKFASTQFNVTDQETVERVFNLQELLDPEDVIDYEKEPHITVRFGLHTDVVDPVRWISYTHGPVTVRLGRLSLFRTEENDVLKVDVDSDALVALHHHLGILPNTSTHPEYRPHLTIAYLKRGAGDKYAGASDLEGVEITFDTLVYSDKNRNHTPLKLGDPTINVFCPTGPGGGIDPTCGPGGSKSTTKSFGTITKDGSKQSKRTQELLLEARDLLVEEFGEFDTSQINVRIKSKVAGEKGVGGALKGNELELLRLGAKGPFGSQQSEDDVLTSAVHELTHKLQRERGWLKGVGKDATFLGVTDWGSYENRAHEIQARFTSHYLVARRNMQQGSIDKTTFERVYKPEHTQPKWALDRSLKRETRNSITANTVWQFLTRDQQVQEFAQWLKTQVAITMLARAQSLGLPQDSWVKEHIERTFQKGMVRSFDVIKHPQLQENLDFYRGTRQQFLIDSFNRPASLERVNLLSGRAFNELQGVTDHMATQMQRSLVNGFIQGKNPRDIARDLTHDVEKIGKKQANRIAHTEVVRAHNEGLLEGLESLGVAEVGVAVEWETSGLGITAKGYASPCPLCAPLKGVVLSVKEARGIFPRHPYCRCSFVPANVGEDHKGQKRSKTSITKAISKSISAERPKKTKRTIAEQKKKTSWAGGRSRIAKRRPKDLVYS